MSADLVLSHRRVVRAMAWKFMQRVGMPDGHLDDLVQEGLEVLLRELPKFDPARGAFATFLRPRVCSAFFRYALAQGLFRTHYRATWEVEQVPLDGEALQVPALAVPADERAEASRLASRVRGELLRREAAQRSRLARPVKPERNVDAFLACRLAGVDAAQVARSQGVSTSALCQAVRRIEAVFEAWAAEVRAELSAA